MKNIWIDISDIPAEGREFTFSDQEVWTEPAVGFNMDIAFTGHIEAMFKVWPHGGRGCTVSGRITGEVSMPCGRCTESAAQALDLEFEVSESLDDKDLAGEPLLRTEDGKIELDAATILWEQFVLALPGKPLCDPGCKGLCPQCGADLNKEACTCAQDEGDPRLAALRGLKITNRKN